MKTLTSKLIVAVLLSQYLSASFAAQTTIRIPGNNHDIQTDLQIKELVLSKIERSIPFVNDKLVTGYIEMLGAEITANIPEEYRRPEFQFRFKVIDTPEVGIYAIPGGEIYVSKGLIEAVTNGVQLVGIMAHAVSHVLLRHYTAKLPKLNKIDWLILENGIWASLRGHTGFVAEDGRQIRSYDYMIRFDLKSEQQADLLGALLMAGAKYDPNNLANIFIHVAFKNVGRGSCLMAKAWDERKRLVYSEAKLLEAAGLYDPKTQHYDRRAFRAVSERLNILRPK